MCVELFAQPASTICCDRESNSAVALASWAESAAVCALDLASLYLAMRSSLDSVLSSSGGAAADVFLEMLPPSFFAGYSLLDGDGTRCKARSARSKPSCEAKPAFSPARRLSSPRRLALLRRHVIVSEGGLLQNKNIWHWRWPLQNGFGQTVAGAGW